MYAPRPAIVFLIGSPKEGRRLPPPPYPQPRRDPPWAKRDVPPGEREALQRRVEKALRETRVVREAIKAAGLALLDRARERRTGVPYLRLAA